MDEMLIQLSGEGISAQSLSSDSAFDEKKLLFTIIDRDDALTAQKYYSSIDDFSVSKTNFIWIDHHAHKFLGLSQSIKDTDIHIYSLAPNLAVAHIGKRLQGLSRGMSPALDWSYLKGYDFSLANAQENQQWVESLEKKNVSGGQPFFKHTVTRFYDRALIYWVDIESSALRDILIEKHGINPAAIECVSLHRWNELRLLAQFEKKSLAPELFRGLLLFSVDLAKDSALESKIKSAYEDLKKMQS